MLDAHSAVNMHRVIEEVIEKYEIADKVRFKRLVPRNFDSR